jgi:hypothetical protein
MVTGSRRRVGENGSTAILICIRQIVIDLLDVELQKSRDHLTHRQIHF